MEEEEAEGEKEHELRRRSQTLDPTLQFFSTFFLVAFNIVAELIGR